MMEKYKESAIIEAWLRGDIREEIVRGFGISDGTASRIKEEAIKRLGRYDFDAVRQFARVLRKNNMKAQDCFIGFRIHSILEKLKIPEKDLEEFLLQISEFSEKMDINPEIVREGLLDIVKISNEIPMSEIPNYLQKIKEEKVQSENEKQNLHAEIQKLEAKESATKERVNSALKDANVTENDLSHYVNMKSKFEQLGIPFDNIDKFANCVQTIASQCNFSSYEVIEKYSDLKEVEKEKNAIQDRKEELYRHINELERIEMNYQDRLNSKSIIMDKLYELEEMGFGIQDLRKIIAILKEIARDHNLNFRQVKDLFFQYFDKYEMIIGLQEEFAKLSNGIMINNKEIKDTRRVLFSQGLVGIYLQNLINYGLNEWDILYIKNFIDSLSIAKGDGAGTLIESNKILPVPKALSPYSDLKLTLERPKEEEEEKEEKKLIGPFADSNFNSDESIGSISPIVPARRKTINNSKIPFEGFDSIF